MRQLKALLAVLCLFFAGIAGAQNLREGRDYHVVASPQATEPGKIEVIEFFSYMCPHCAHFEPVLAPWVKALPKDVVFRRVPAIFRPQWEAPARLYFTLEGLNEIDRLHGAVFNAIHGESANLTTDEAVADWVAKKGFDRKKFADVYSSFTMQSKLQRARQATAAYGIASVPSMVVGGKYRTPTENFTGGQEDLLKTVDALIAKVRSEQKR